MSGAHHEERKIFSVALPEELSVRLTMACERTGKTTEALVELALKKLFRKGAGGAVYLSAPFDALMKGVYEENTTIGEVRRHGDFGIGTFNDLDGEMVLLDGVAYQLRSDGRALLAGDEVQTPFACVTFFNPISTEEVDREVAADAFDNLLERLIPSANQFCALRLEGEFSYMKVWSVPKQPVDQPMSQVRLSSFEYREVEGTLAGFYSPRFIKSLNKPGFHLHFLNRDCSHGGHLHQCALKRARIEVQLISRLELDLPSTLDYLTADLI